MPDTDPDLPADPELQRVTFHVDEGSPGGFVGTIIEDPSAESGTDSWLFYAYRRLIARAQATGEGWRLQVRDEQFIESHRLTARMLEDLFERGSSAPHGPCDAFASRTG